MKKKILILTILTAFYACQKEPIPESPSSTVSGLKTVELSEARELLQRAGTSTSSKTSEDNFFTPNWEYAHYEDLNNTEEKILVIPAENNFKKLGFSRILMWEKDGETIIRAFTMFPNGNKFSKVFKGKMIVTDLDVNFIIGYKAKNGLIFAKLFKSKSSFKCSDYTGGDWDCGELDEVVIESTPTTNTNEMDDGSDTGGGGSYQYPEGEEEPTWDYNQLPGGGGSGTDTDTEENEEEDASVDRDPSFIAIDKINCTYEQLIKAGSLEGILRDFFGVDANFNITYSVVQDLVCNGKTTVTGCATQLNDYNYLVKIDKEYILNDETPTIFLAQSIIHESIHANLFAAVVKYNNGSIPVDTSFEALYEDYRKIQGWQHEIMADHYISIMKQALRAAHLYLNDDNFLNGYDDNNVWNWNEFYDYITHRGLRDTEAGKLYFGDEGNNISLYFEGAKSFSTKQPVCDDFSGAETEQDEIIINDGSGEKLTEA